MINRHHPMQNNKPCKAMHTCKYSIWGEVLWQIQQATMPHTVFPTQPYLLCCIFHTALTAILYLVYNAYVGTYVVVLSDSKNFTITIVAEQLFR